MRPSRHVIALGIYTVLALALTFPLITQIGDHVPGTATWSLDEYGYVWNHWWFKYALFDRAQNPFFTNFLFYPVGASLVLYAYTLLHVALGLPLQFAFGLIPAVNLTVLFSFVVAAFGMYLFVFYFLRVSLDIWNHKFDARLGVVASNQTLHALAAFVAGLAFGFTSNRFVYVSLGHYNIVASEWLPFYLLFFFKTLLEPDPEQINLRLPDSAGKPTVKSTFVDLQITDKVPALSLLSGSRRTKGRFRVRLKRFQSPLLAGLFAALALYTETTDGVLIALLSAVILTFEWRLLNRATLQRVGAIIATAAILFSPILIPTLNEIFASGYSLPGWGHSEKLLVDLNGFFTPTSLHPLTRNWENELDLVRQQISRFSDVNTFFVGYASALLALAGFLLFARRNRLWLIIVFGFAILTLGPLLHVNGVSEFDLDGITTTVPLPFLVLHYIPLVKENRVPNRYSILVTIGLAVLIGYAVWWLLSQVARRRNPEFILSRVEGWLPTSAAVCGLLSAVLLFEHLAIPLPLTDARVPDVYAQIAREPGDFSVLSLPLGWRNSFGQLGAEDTRTQYYEAISHKFLLSGQIQRNTLFLFDYFERAPILSSIIALETYQNVDDATVKRDRDAANAFVYFFDARYLVVNAPVANRPPYSDTHDRVLQYLQQVLPLGDKLYDNAGTIAYRINEPPPPPRLEIDFGTDAARLYLGDGWTGDVHIAGATANWGTRQNAQVFFPARELRDYALSVRALPFAYDGAPNQTLQLTVNGHALDPISLKPAWNEYQLTIPRDALLAGVNVLQWKFGYLARPRDVIAPNFEIGQTGVKSPVDLAVQSTPEFGSIKLAGREVSPLKRGYNFAVIDPKSGALIEAKNFDTGGTSILESRALTDFVSKISEGMIVAGAVQEDASAILGDRAVASIRSLGLITDLRGTAGRTHAFIAVKGKPGALEQSQAGTSAVSVGHSVDDRTLSVAFDRIRIEPK